jgi:hypothetical protein
MISRVVAARRPPFDTAFIAQEAISPITQDG